MGRQTNSSQATTGTRAYDAFGMLVSSTGTPQGPFGFAGGYGYQEDADSGLKLLGHRYYDPSTGRFLTRDPAKDGRNWYGYCENEPTWLIDSDGLDKQEVLPVIRRGISKGTLPPGTAKEYQKNGRFRRAIHCDIGKEKRRRVHDKETNKDLSDQDVEEIIIDNLPDSLREPPPEYYYDEGGHLRRNHGEVRGAPKIFMYPAPSLGPIVLPVLGPFGDPIGEPIFVPPN